MKAWSWIAAAAMWMIALLVVRFHFGSIGIAVSDTSPASLATARFTFYLVQYGWAIPLSVGILRLLAKD